METERKNYGLLTVRRSADCPLYFRDEKEGAGEVSPNRGVCAKSREGEAEDEQVGCDEERQLLNARGLEVERVLLGD